MKNLKKKLFTFFVAVVTALTTLSGGVAAATTTVFADELPDVQEDAVAEAGVDMEVAELTTEEQDAALLQDAAPEQTDLVSRNTVEEEQDVISLNETAEVSQPMQDVTAAETLEEPAEENEAEISLMEEDTSAAVTINDENLRKAIALNLGVEYTEGMVITENMMAQLTELNAENAGIIDLTGIDKAVNLVKLDLSGNPLDDNKRTQQYQFGSFMNLLKDLSKLEELDLSDCRLGDNCFTDSGTSSATGDYKIPGEPVNFWATLGSMPSLVRVDVSNNGIYGKGGLISYLPFPYFYSGDATEMNLESIDLSGNNLSGFQIGYIDLESFSVAEGTAYYPHLKEVNLDDNRMDWEMVSQDISAALLSGVSVSHKNLQNPAKIFLVMQENATGKIDAKSSPFFFPQDGRSTVKLSNVTGDSVQLVVMGYVEDGMTVEVNGQTYAAAGYSEVKAAKAKVIKIENLQDGINRIPVTVSYNGQTSEYTFIISAKAFTAQEETDGEDGAVKIVDQDIYKYLLGLLGKESGYVITKKDLASISGNLTIPACTDMSWLQYCTGIRALLYSETNWDNPTSSFTSIPDLSGLTKLRTLYICSSNLQEAPDLSKLSSLQLLYTHPAKDGTWPKLSENNLKTLHLYSCEGKLPDDLSSLNNLGSIYLHDTKEGEIYHLDNTNLPVSDKLMQIMVDGAATVAIGEAVGLFGNSQSMVELQGDTRLTISDPENTELKRIILRGTADESRLPDTLKALPAISTMEFRDMQLTSLPDSLEHLSELKVLRIDNTDLTDFNVDLSKTKLENVTIENSKLTAMPSENDLPETVKLMNLDGNQIRNVDADYSKLTVLRQLDLSMNPIPVFPAFVKQLPALEYLDLSWGLYPEIPEDAFDGLTKLTTVRVGSYFDGAQGNYDVDPESSVGKAIAALKERNGGTLNFFASGVNGVNPASLSSFQVDDDVVGFDAADILTSFSKTYAEETETINVKVAAVHPDTEIAIGDKTVTGSGTFELPLEAGENSLKIVTTRGDRTKTYTINAYRGKTVSVDTLEAGRYYSVDSRMKKYGTDNFSMADAYFEHKSWIRPTDDGKYEIYLFCTGADMIDPTQVFYYDETGTSKMQAEIVERNLKAGTATMRCKLDTLPEQFVSTMYVYPMGSSPKFDVCMDFSSILDITDEMPTLDKTELNAAVIGAQEIAQKRNIYTEESYKAFAAALKTAEDVADATGNQETVDAAASALQNAVDALVVDDAKLADKTSLEDALAAAKALEKGKHTDSNWEALQEAIADAQVVYDDLYASTKEAEVQAKALNNAVKSFNSSGEASALNPASLEDGVYSVYVDMINAANPSQKSMSDGAVTKPMTLTVKDGEYTITTSFHGLYITLAGQSFFGYLKELSYQDGVDAAGKPVYKPVTVDTTYDVVDEYNDADGDGKADFAYPHQMSFPLVNKNLGDDEDGFVHVQVFVPIMEAIAAGSGTQQALMKIDWSSLTEGAPVTDEDINLENATIMNLSNKTYTGKAIEQTPLVILNDKVLKADVDYEVAYENNSNAGTATVTVTGKGVYTGTAKATFKINAAKQTATVKAKTKTVKASKLKKKAQTVKGAITIKKVKGKKQVTYTKVKKGSSKNLTINKKTGKITVKKGTKKGTYKIKVKVKVADKNKNYKTVTKTVTVTVKVK